MSTSTAPYDQVRSVLRHLPPRLRLGTRRSLLARTQSQWVADRLSAALAGAGLNVQVELVEVTTSGDLSSAPLSTLGGTGVFASALRDALREGRIDFAVHSLKDLPTAAADGLTLAALPPREDPRDVLIARDGLTLAGLPAGATVGTGSPRRAAQLRALGLELAMVDARGNVDTRLRLVSDGVLDAVVLARAGLLRIGRHGEATEVLEPEVMLPAPGQGALAVEARVDDVPVVTALKLLDDAATRACVLAERSLLARLEAGCAAPVGALADVTDGAAGGGLVLSLRAVVGSLDGSISIRRTATTVLDPSSTTSTPAAEATAMTLGLGLAEQLLGDGAADLIPVPSRLPVAAHPVVPGTAAKVKEGDS